MTKGLATTWIPDEIAALVTNGSVVTIGNFDGVHRGHQTILSDVHESAEVSELPSVAVTFEPHPVTVFRGTPPGEFRISSSADRESLLRDAGVTAVWTVPFSREFAAITAEEFVDELLVQGLQARFIHVGYDFNFGRGRAGTPEMLKERCESQGIPVVVHEAFGDGDGAISSTRVRDAIRSGDLGLVEALLGRRYRVAGAAASGHGRGKKMGVPTVNVYPTDQLLPPFGVYATVLRFDGHALNSISNLGVRPTFDDDDRVSLETMALTDWPDGAAPQEVQVELLEYIRPEQRFDDRDALVAQIRRDVERANAVHQVATSSSSP